MINNKLNVSTPLYQSQGSNSSNGLNNIEGNNLDNFIGDSSLDNMPPCNEPILQNYRGSEVNTSNTNCIIKHGVV